MLPWFLKIIAAVIGAIFALTLSGDIDTQGRIKINISVIMKFVFSVAISLYGGSAFIEYYDLANYYSHMAQDFVTTDAGSVAAYIGSREKSIGSKFSIRYSDTTGVKEVFRTDRFGIAKSLVGFRMDASPISSSSGFTNVLFVDEADNKLKFRDGSGVVRIVNTT